jgi:hypothetical protein
MLSTIAIDGDSTTSAGMRGASSPSIMLSMLSMPLVGAASTDAVTAGTLAATTAAAFASLLTIGGAAAASGAGVTAGVAVGCAAACGVARRRAVGA